MPQDDRYSRQIRFAPIGEAGQDRLRSSRVLVVGLGALGTVTADQIIRAGVGFVRLIDRDFVELSNLQRQSLFDEEDIRSNLPKAIAAEAKLRRVNSSVEIEVKDQGEGFDPKDVPDPTDPANIMKTSGRGIFLIRSFVDEVDWSMRPEGGTTVRLVKRF